MRLLANAIGGIEGFIAFIKETVAFVARLNESGFTYPSMRGECVLTLSTERARELRNIGTVEICRYNSQKL